MTDDLRETPTYTFSEAAHYLRVPVDTLRHWLLGNPFRTKAGDAYSKPLIAISGRDPNLLSFHNLVEAHVLSALRRRHRISMPKVRRALDYLQEKHPSPHPLADYWFQTDGIDIFITEYGKLESITRHGQLAISEFIQLALRRVERDNRKIAVRLYPFTSEPPAADARFIVIDPRVSFGRPVIAGSGVPTSIIAERWVAGELVKELADDYDRTPQEIEEALRCELWRQAA